MCGDHFIVDTKQYTDYTLAEMSYKAKCKKCQGIGIDVSVEKLKAY